MNILFNEKSTCCGCTACAAVCPQHAIEMLPDENGFFYPRINEEKCIHCNLCKLVCSYQKQQPDTLEKEVFVAVSQNTNISESASGGIFSGFAKNILAKGGVVYGSTMQYENGQLHTKHIKVVDEAELCLLKGSKYVHSDMHNIFQDVQAELKKGTVVLFSGTPCQISGLKGFLRKDYPNLFTMDIICHGVPSEQLFQKYIAYEEQKNKSKIVDFRFRDKKEGWQLHGAMTFENGRTVYFEPEKSSYYQLFLNSYTYRENCYSCPYASEHRPGDITIGDYWCIELVHPELLLENGGQIDHRKGVSCMIINSNQGKKLLKEYGSGIKYWISSYENASRYNRQLSAPSQLKAEREIVLDLAQKDYKLLELWYQRKCIPIKINRFIRQSIPRPVKDIIKRFIKKKGNV